MGRLSSWGRSIRISRIHAAQVAHSRAALEAPLGDEELSMVVDVDGPVAVCIGTTGEH